MENVQTIQRFRNTRPLSTYGGIFSPPALRRIDRIRATPAVLRSDDDLAYLEGYELGEEFPRHAGTISNAILDAHRERRHERHAQPREAQQA